MDAPKVYGNTTEPVAQSKRWLTDDHVDKKRVVIKILEVLLSFIAFICEEVVNNCSDCGALYFFEFVSCTAFLFTILLLILLKTTLFKSVGINHLPYVDFVFTLGIAVFFLIASCVFAAHNYGTTLERTAIVFGFLATIAFLIDVGLIYKDKGFPWSPKNHVSTPNPENKESDEQEKLNANGNTANNV
ncbi:CKLF-like MARVEL transmembrane domain-containing protein 6 [Acipenser oxyrinchus oxyrinchus]|uniref:CKLF-like MARVEL transmembrane domain-containing protein 6 n=1 Tax=Acipenser oxyrinchus oxyrinchus TaxID=40147 RepID=A0AAD8GDM2_ACIOX|nr:CKLF-like MARVEL transmembrane domain-containing protein 6 [Acipenser oxyrinchus oxyrinchus]